jgi:hypothetical protein
MAESLGEEADTHIADGSRHLSCVNLGTSMERPCALKTGFGALERA